MDRMVVIHFFVLTDIYSNSIFFLNYYSLLLLKWHLILMVDTHDPR